MKLTGIFAGLALVAMICFSGCNGKQDPCENVLCLNGGTCVDGTCECPPGYKGTPCEIEVKPSKIKITKVEITKWPYYDSNGDVWDPDDMTGPDLYIRITFGKKEIYKYNKQFWDAKINQTYTFNLKSNPVELTDNLESKYKIQLWDYEEYNNDDFMAELEFIPYQAGKNFPATLELGDYWSELGCTLYLEYEF